jgi:hypothetical protein
MVKSNSGSSSNRYCGRLRRGKQYGGEDTGVSKMPKSVTPSMPTKTDVPKVRRSQEAEAAASVIDVTYDVSGTTPTGLPDENASRRLQEQSVLRLQFPNKAMNLRQILRVCATCDPC